MMGEPYTKFPFHLSIIVRWRREKKERKTLLEVKLRASSRDQGSETGPWLLAVAGIYHQPPFFPSVSSTKSPSSHLDSYPWPSFKDLAI
ncbi:hypothetical protein M5K25_024492 [Dendrobium thyrsiflorum]|uniref:Uncharacterized protein n=1 Tax=Dendrobium thyrsiflorum TaxID=117978 RepID=A0ABD0U2A6_DENTH